MRYGACRLNDYLAGPEITVAYGYLRTLKAWERCHELCVAVYHATKSWPTDERFGLSSQARRAAHSAAANIAEGCAKKGSAEFRRYLNISLGSLSERSYTLLLARD